MKSVLTLIPAFASLFLVFTLGACQSSKAEFQSLDVEEFSTAIASPQVQRLDVRTVIEFTEGHIPGSININVLDEEHFAQYADSLLHKEEPVALYCRSGKRSKKAASILSDRGYDVIELDKGFNSWQSAGKEVEK